MIMLVRKVVVRAGLGRMRSGFWRSQPLSKATVEPTKPLEEDFRRAVIMYGELAGKMTDLGILLGKTQAELAREIGKTQAEIGKTERILARGLLSVSDLETMPWLLLC